MAVAMLRTMLDVDPNHPVAAFDVRGLLARWRRGGGAYALSTAVLRQDRRLGRRRCDQQRHQVSDAGPAAGLVRSEDLDLDDRPRSVRIATRRLDDVATPRRSDVGMLNQEACVCSRVLFVEGEREQVGFLRAAPENWSSKTPSPARRRRCRATWPMRSRRSASWTTSSASGASRTARTGGAVGRAGRLPSDQQDRQRRARDVARGRAKYVNVATQTVGVYPPRRWPSCATASPRRRPARRPTGRRGRPVDRRAARRDVHHASLRPLDRPRGRAGGGLSAALRTAIRPASSKE